MAELLRLECRSEPQMPLPLESDQLGLPFIPGKYAYPFATYIGSYGPLTVPKPVIKLEMRELDSSYEIIADLPGVPKSDLEISIHESTGVLTICANKKYEEPSTVHVKYIIVNERELWGEGLAKRSVLLPANANHYEAAAQYKDGVLKISMPKFKKSLEIAGYLKNE